jgi:hypothetical protein
MEEIQNKVIKKIEKIFESNSITTDIPLEIAVQETFDRRENNLRLFCKSSDSEFVFKYELGELSTGVKQVGVRAKMNLRNEIRFYERSKDITLKNLVIPKYISSSSGEEAWLIIEKLDLNKIHIFNAKDGFTERHLPEFLIDPLIKGIDELHNMDIHKEDFVISDINNIITWLNSCEPAFTGKVTGLLKEVLRLAEKHSSVWTEQLKYIVHSDLMADTLGYDKGTHKVMILDFEKVQISNHGFDFASLIRNPFAKKWNGKFEKSLFDYYKNNEFEITYLLACITRGVSALSSLKSGRLDRVFVGILGQEEFNRLRPQLIDLYEEQLLDRIEKLKNY